MTAIDDLFRPSLSEGWEVGEDWNEHECFYDEDSGDEWCIHVYRVYGPGDVSGPCAGDEVEAVNAAIDAGLLPEQRRWRWATAEEAAQEKAERMARIGR